MSTVKPTPQLTKPGSQPSQRLTLADVTGKSSGLPNRYIVHGCEGTGKTSWAAYSPSPVFIQSKGETGLETLITSGLLPEVPHFPEVQDYGQLFNCLDVLTNEEHSFRTLVIDTLNGVERLIHEEVCRRSFNNDWTDKGFMGYMRGYEVSLADVRKLLNALDELRAKRRMSVICLCHTKVKPFKNPEGPDYDRFQPDMHEKTWGLCHKWADGVLFLNYETFVTESGPTKKVKATGGQTRIMFTERHAAYDAKNRMGLPSEIEMGSNAQESWTNFINALKSARKVD